MSSRSSFLGYGFSFMGSQVVAIVLLILESSMLSLTRPLHLLGTGLLYLALILALVSGGQYLVNFWRNVATKKF